MNAFEISGRWAGALGAAVLAAGCVALLIAGLA
jgi:hypothetical protein